MKVLRKIKSKLFLLSLATFGCGGGSVTPTGPPPPPPATVNLNGTWQFILHSNVFTKHYAVLEVNLSQSGAQVFAGPAAALLFEADPALSNTTPPKLLRFGDECTSSVPEVVVVDGTLQDHGNGSGTVDLKISETGTTLVSLTEAIASTDGSSITGSYTNNDPCYGYEPDRGTFAGLKYSMKFSGETYSGFLNAGADLIVAQITSAATGFNLTFSGTDNGTPFVLTGSTIGASFDLTGSIANNAVHWFGLYDSTNKTFQIYDANALAIGGLHPGAQQLPN